MSQVKIFATILPSHCLFRLSGLKGDRWTQWVLQGQQSVIQGSPPRPVSRTVFSFLLY